MTTTAQLNGSNQPSDSRELPSYQVQLPMFQGPLDLLLHLIEREELDITKVALAQVTDQYLVYLAVLREVEVDFLTDFLVVAAKLLLIKSQALLPRPPPSLVLEEDQDAGDELAHQLRLYRQFKMAAQILRQREVDGFRNFVRLAMPPKPEPRLSPGETALDDLVLAARQALAVRADDPAVGEVVAPLIVTIGQQMAMIRDRLRWHQRITFRQLVGRPASRVETIVTFLALLELLKQGELEVRQKANFGDILLLPAAAPARASAQTSGLLAGEDVPQPI